jgi:hypothetical protein
MDFWRTPPLIYLKGQNRQAVDGPQRVSSQPGEALLRRVKFAFKPAGDFAGLKGIKPLAL